MCQANKYEYLGEFVGYSWFRWQIWTGRIEEYSSDDDPDFDSTVNSSVWGIRLYSCVFAICARD